MFVESFFFFFCILAHEYYKLEENDNFDFSKTNQIVNMISTVGFESVSEKSYYQFEKMLHSLSKYKSKSALIYNNYNKKDNESIELIKIRIFINKVLKNKNFKNLLIMESKIFFHLTKNINAFNINTIKNMILLLKNNHYINCIYEKTIKLNNQNSRI